MDTLDWSLLVLAPADVLLVVGALVLRGWKDRRWFLEALCQGIVVGGGSTFVISVGLGMATGSGVLPAFLILLLGPLLFGVTFGLGLAGVYGYRFLP